MSLEALELIIKENDFKQHHKHRIIKKFRKLHKRGGLTEDHIRELIGNSASPKVWAWRYCSACLMMSEYDDWWGYECRSDWTWHLAHKENWRYKQYEGQEDVSVMFLAEQGIGDEIIFASAYNDLIEDLCEEKNCEVIIECDDRLIDIYERSFIHPKIHFEGRWNGTYPRSDKLRPYQLEDVRPWEAKYDITHFAPAGNVPKFYRRSRADFPREPYLRADPEKVSRWKDCLSGLAGGQPIVGVCAVAGATEEKEVGVHEIAEGFPVNLHHYTKYDDIYQPEWSDIDDLCALVGACDYINSVPSAVVHMAGSIGVKTNVIKPPPVFAEYKEEGKKNNRLKWYYANRKKHMDWYGDHVRIYESPAAWRK